MRHHNRIRVPYFKALLDQMRKQALQPQNSRQIVRQPGNPMLRYAAGVDSIATTHHTQEKLDL